MKKILLSIILFSSVIALSQTVILDEKFSDNNLPVKFKYLPKSEKLVFYKGKLFDKDTWTTTAVSYDHDGKQSYIFENKKIRSCTFSVTENSYSAVDYTKDWSWTPNYTFFFNNDSKVVTKETLENLYFDFFGLYDGNNVLIAQPSGRSDFDAAFNDSYIFGFSNQKKKRILNLEKDDIYLEIVEIKSNTRKRVLLEKPNLALLVGDSFAKTDHDQRFTCKLNGNDNFYLITKSISKDFHTTIMYKTTYDFDGKKIKTIPFTLRFDDKFFVTSRNGGGPAKDASTTSAQSSRFVDEAIALDQSSINNYLEDRKNGDIYIYGIFSDQTQKKMDGRIHPKGYYVFKFDKEGNKIWESVNYIEGKDNFEKIGGAPYLKVNLLEYNKNLVFSVSASSSTSFTNAAIVDKVNGSLLKTSFLEYDKDRHLENYKTFITQTYDYKEFKNKTFPQIAFAAISLNDKVFNYLKSVPEGKNRLFYEIIYSDQGIWLVETDNENYYKVLSFKD